MASSAFLFPGQGSQSLGMLAGLAEQFPEVGETFSAASEVLGYDLWSLCQQGPEERLNQTEMTQPAMLAAGVATWRAWKAQGGFDPDYMAGHSLGEYSALVAAGSLDFEAAIALVAERGRLMQAATPPGAGAMAAVLGLEDEVLSRLCEEAAGGEIVSCANFNSPGQVVIAGNRAAVERACALAGEAGARKAIPLAVSVPSHCALMRPAADRLADRLRSVNVDSPGIRVLHNVDVEVHEDPDEIRRALVQQLWRPVRWSGTILSLAAMGVTHFAECGPGKVLTGLNRRISREITSTALLSAEDMEQTKASWS
jgi:[acyl-carrier-protein] S-malonyltransferase